MIHELAPAKLNVSLEVVGRRPDGYHEVATIFQTIGLYDELAFEPHDELVLESSDPALAGPTNLVLRAARLLQEATEQRDGARMRLIKRIPVASGLGGGSADGAAALRGLRRLWRLHLADDRLVDLASRLGADVPFLLRGGAALATGIGERLEALPSLAGVWAVVYAPDIGLPNKTARAYAGLRVEDFSDGSRTRALADGLRVRRRVDLAAAPNAFRRVAEELFPGLADHEARLIAAGAPWARLTGAGPTLFTLVEERGRAEAIRASLSSEARAWAVPTVVG